MFDLGSQPSYSSQESPPQVEVNDWKNDPQYEEVKKKAGWFFWIAGLSAITSIISHNDGNFAFALGLGFTQFIDAVVIGLSESLGWGAKIFGLVFDLIFAGIFVALGYAARSGKQKIYLFGIILYAIDAIIFILVFDLLSILLHGLALFYLIQGYRLIGNLLKFYSEVQVQQPE